MATTPGKPRVSGLPTPARQSSLPTPGRLRSSSTSIAAIVLSEADHAGSLHALQDAIKANDPGRYKIPVSLPDEPSGTPSHLPELKPLAQSRSGRKSAASRPSSVSSSTSGPGSTPAASRHSADRGKTPSRRSASRVSDAAVQNTNRTATRPLFEHGDSVRIESLGFEGILRYVGEIEGKTGIWAGVELNGGFAGKGKNDGSVDEKYYFRCPPKCGVFVSISKLSPPTVAPGAMSRPSSVASSYGRMTPSFSGRVTPSSTGYSTPYGFTSGGRITPASIGAHIYPRTPSAQAHTKRPPSATSDASAYDLSRTSVPPSPMHGHVFVGNSAAVNSHSSSFVPSASMATPRPSSGRNKGLVGLGLPSTTPTKGQASGASSARNRLPSALAMPPPISPVSTSKRDNVDLEVAYTHENGAGTLADSRSSSQSLQGEISVGMLASPSGILGSDDAFATRVAKLEVENERLRGLLGISQEDELEGRRRQEELRRDKEEALARISNLETSINAAETLVHERDVKIRSLESKIDSVLLEADTARKESGLRISDLQSHLDNTMKDVVALKELVSVQESAEQQTSSLLKAQEVDLATLRDQVRQAYLELDEQRREVDALRTAGQETIALYEERLSEAESRRYGMQAEIALLQEKSRSRHTESSSSIPKAHSPAAEIENETLRDQIAHLQKKINSLEDLLEDARASAHADEASYTAKLARFKDKEETWRRQLSDGEKEIDRLRKADHASKARVEEVEEAFREGAIALENAHIEIEGLRADIATLDSQSSTKSASHADATPANSLATLSLENKELRERLRRIAIEEAELQPKKVHHDQLLSCDSGSSSPSRYELAVREELAGLKHIIQELQKENVAVAQENELLKSENGLLLSEAGQLRRSTHAPDGIQRTVIDEEALHLSAETGNDMEILQKTIEGLRLKYESETEQLKRRQSESEIKYSRTVHDLNKEIGELESLVEAKIYREGELEQEVDRLKEKLTRSSRKIPRGTSELSTSPNQDNQMVADEKASFSSRCEVCERSGHDIFDCSALDGNSLSPTAPAVSTISVSYCEDCESYGHIAADCSHSMDVF